MLKKHKKVEIEKESFDPKKSKKPLIIGGIIFLTVVGLVIYNTVKPARDSNVTAISSEKISINAPKKSYSAPPTDKILAGHIYKDEQGVTYSFQSGGVLNVDGSEAGSITMEGLSYTLQNNKLTINIPSQSKIITGTLSEDKKTITNEMYFVNPNGGTTLTLSSVVKNTQDSSKNKNTDGVEAEFVGKVSSESTTASKKSENNSSKVQTLSQFADTTDAANKAAKTSLDGFFNGLIEANKMSANVPEIKKTLTSKVVKSNSKLIDNAISNQYFLTGTIKRGGILTAVTGAGKDSLQMMIFVPITVNGQNSTALFYASTTAGGNQLKTLTYQGTIKG